MGDPFVSIRRAVRTAQSVASSGDEDKYNRVIASVAAFHREKRYAPSVRDIAHELAWTQEPTRDAIKLLCEAGFLAQEPRANRSLRVALPADRLAARKTAWLAALRSLPASELEAAGGALAEILGVKLAAPASPSSEKAA